MRLQEALTRLAQVLIALPHLYIAHPLTALATCDLQTMNYEQVLAHQLGSTSCCKDGFGQQSHLVRGLIQSLVASHGFQVASNCLLEEGPLEISDIFVVRRLTPHQKSLVQFMSTDHSKGE